MNERANLRQEVIELIMRSSTCPKIWPVSSISLTSDELAAECRKSFCILLRNGVSPHQPAGCCLEDSVVDYIVAEFIEFAGQCCSQRACLDHSIESNLSFEPAGLFLMKYVIAVEPTLEKMVRAANQNSREEVNQFCHPDRIDVDKIPFFQLVPSVQRRK